MLSRELTKYEQIIHITNNCFIINVTVYRLNTITRFMPTNTILSFNTKIRNSALKHADFCGKIHKYLPETNYSNLALCTSKEQALHCIFL